MCSAIKMAIAVETRMRARFSGEMGYVRAMDVKHRTGLAAFLAGRPRRMRNGIF